MTQFVHALAPLPLWLFQNELIFNTFPQEARLATHPGTGILQRQSDKNQDENHPEHNVHATIKIGRRELYQNRFKRRIRLHHIDHDMSKVEHDRINAFWFSCRVFINFSKEISVEINAGIKITQPKILFKTAMRPAC